MKWDASPQSAVRFWHSAERLRRIIHVSGRGKLRLDNTRSGERRWVAGPVQQRGTFSAQSDVIKNSVVGEMCVSAFRARARLRNGVSGEVNSHFSRAAPCANKTTKTSNSRSTDQ